MKPYYEDTHCTIYHGDCRDIMPQLEPNSIDYVLTDPPYEFGFMGKQWDCQGVSFQVMTWEKARNACKPGAMLMAFGGTRTWHRLCCAIEDAGWEIRYCLMYLYGSGFPKSLDISKAIDKEAGVEHPIGEPISDNRSMSGPNYTGPKMEVQTDAAKLWNGWGTALKPAWEPIVLAMKPLDGTFAQNAQKHGVAGINVDGGGIGVDKIPAQRRGQAVNTAFCSGGYTPEHTGRWPANLLLDESAAAMLDVQSGELQSGKPSGKRNVTGYAGGLGNGKTALTGIGDSGGASRFFYTSKASHADRAHDNDHPTVKPLDLMKIPCPFAIHADGRSHP